MASLFKTAARTTAFRAAGASNLRTIGTADRTFIRKKATLPDLSCKTVHVRGNRHVADHARRLWRPGASYQRQDHGGMPAHFLDRRMPLLMLHF